MPPTAVSGRVMNLASSICLGLPLAVLIAGAWLVAALPAGQAWWPLLGFAAVSAVLARRGSLVDEWLLRFFA